MFENPRRDKQAKKFDNKFSENSRSQIVFRTDFFPKIDVGCPWRAGKWLAETDLTTRSNLYAIIASIHKLNIFKFHDQASKTLWV